MCLKRALLYVHSLRYLKPVQITNRLSRKIFPWKTPAARPVILRSPKETWTEAIPHRASLEGWTFRFLNEEGTLQSAEDWNHLPRSKLWLYNLHYHDHLLSQGALSGKEALITRWIQDNPIQKRGVGWEPYPLSLRIQNWIKFAQAQGGLSPEALASLHLQAQALFLQIEYHLLGNHLFENAKSLVFAGLFFQGPEAEAWLKIGVQLLTQEIQEQVLPDGGHFERSPMYHAQILEGLLDTYNLLHAYKVEPPLQTQIRAVVPSMLFWLRTLCHSDGEIAFFNDATLGIAPVYEDLLAYAGRVGIPSKTTLSELTYHTSSGFLRLEKGPALLLADVGSLGPSYIPGHAHAETFSFELSFKDKRCLVNTGISTYQGAERTYERSTRAHNTLSLDGQNSSEVWGAFRVAQRATVQGSMAEDRGDAFVFQAHHSGYRRVLHQRSFVLSDGGLLIQDTLLGKREGEVCIAFHLHPTWQAEVRDHRIHLRHSDLQEALFLKVDPRLQIEIEESYYAPAFGIREKAVLILLKACVTFPHTFDNVLQWGQD